LYKKLLLFRTKCLVELAFLAKMDRLSQVRNCEPCRPMTDPEYSQAFLSTLRPS